ncbi:MAG: thioredoxin family protein [Cytophagaceae bacterium]|nr:thioredoxin family protein [Gemmatimonadaceae bacterium]
MQPPGTEFLASRYADASTLEAFIEAATKNQEFWRGVHRLTRVEEALQERARALPGAWHLLCLAEDWCGDAVQALPVVARLIERAPSIDLRVLRRDTNEDLMQAHLTRGTRSIPVVMVLDEAFREHGWWGPRPRLLQAWGYEVGPTLAPADRSRQKREWYARDRGASTALEVLALLERAAFGGAGDSSDGVAGA